MGVKFSAKDQKLYIQMVRLLHSLTYAVTTRFIQDKDSRVEILNKLNYHATLLLEYTDCGDLCPDKENGCGTCPPKPVLD